MKVQYLVLLVVVALEAGLSVWPESFVAAADGETVVVKPATRKGKSPKKIRRTIRVREAAPASPAAVQPSAPAAAPVQPAAPQQAAPAQPISNEVNVRPDISVHVSPQQQQQHPQQQPHPQQLVRVQPSEPQQQPLIELPDDEDDDDDDDDNHNNDAEDDDGRSVNAENMQIVPYEPTEQSIVPVVEEPQEQQQQKLQIVPRSNLATQLIEAGGEQVKKLLLGAGDLMMPRMPYFGEDSGPLDGMVPSNGDAHLIDPNNTYLNANNINRRYNPRLGWQMGAFAAPGYPAFAAAGQVPVIQVNIDEQVRRPWLTAAGPAMQLQSPYVSASPYAAATPIWQQPASFFGGSPVGAPLPAAAAVYPAAAASPMGLVGAPSVSGYYGSMPAFGQPMVQSAPMMMTAPAMVQQPMMMQPAVMMQPMFLPQPEMKIRRKKAKKQRKPKKQQVVVEVEEPVVEEKTTWVKKEPQFNQYVEERAPATTKVVEVKKPKVEEPEEIEWETVRIPKIKKNDAAAAGQQ